MEDIESVKRKIKKLFALSTSPNPQEAAAALEKAQRLMQEYSVAIDTAELAGLERIEVKTGSKGKSPPPHEGRLMNAIAKAFGCRRAYGYGDGNVWYKVHDFIGPEHRVQIASYVAEVLLRKLRRARAAYMKSLRRVRKRHTKICRADEFCRGWVFAVVGKLAEIKNNPEEEKALDEYERSLGWRTRQLPPARPSKNKLDGAKGYLAGKDVAIQDGVAAFGERLALEAAT